MAIYKIGIDFGTTFSFAGMLRGESIQSLVPTNETYGIPSVFYADGKKILVGRLAERQRKNKVVSVKRRLTERAPLLTVGNESYTAERIVEEIIGYVVRSAEKMLKETYIVDFTENDRIYAVITVPVRFSEPTCNLIKRAASRVRLENGSRLIVTSMMKEPVAASIEYFGMRPESNSNILVFDLGGGTLDLAIVHANNLKDGKSIPYEVLAMGGDEHLGGDDWDKCIQDYLIEEYENEYDDDLNDVHKEKFRMEARACKEALTQLDSTTYDIEIRDDVLSGTLTRTQLERMSDGLIKRAIQAVDNLMQENSGITLNHVILTGGSSRMPMIETALREHFPNVDVRMVDPEHAIAYGAARYASTLVYDAVGDIVEEEKPIIQQISAHGYGIKYNYGDGQRICVLIPKGVKLPYTNSTISVTNRENQRICYYGVYETDRKTAVEEAIPVDDGHEIMHVEIRYTGSGIIPKGRKSKDTLILGEDGLLRVEAVDLVDGSSAKNQVKIEREL